MGSTQFAVEVTIQCVWSVRQVFSVLVVQVCANPVSLAAFAPRVLRRPDPAPKEASAATLLLLMEDRFGELWKFRVHLAHTAHVVLQLL